MKVVTDNGTNFTSKKFQSLMERYGVEHACCSLHHHQGNGLAEKSVDTLKRMLLKVPKASIAEACLKLNNMVRPGMKATLMSCFFGRRTRGHLPNLFDPECQIVETIQKRIENQFNLAQRRGHFNSDTFSVGNRVRVQDPASRMWNILGVVSSEIAADDGSTRSYEVETDSGQVLVRNGSHIKHSEKSAAPEQNS